MSDYLDKAEEKIRDIYHNSPVDEIEDRLAKFVKEKLYYSYKNGIRDGKKAMEEAKTEEQNKSESPK